MSFEVRKEVSLDAPPDDVWRAVATPAGLATWFMPMPLDADSDMVADWSPGRRLEIDMGGQGFVYEIEGGPTGSTLRFVHRMAEDLTAQFSPGWDMYFHTMAQYFKHFAGRSATYVEAEAGPSSQSADAWPQLVAAVRSLDGEVDYDADTFVGVRTPDSLVRFHGRWLLGMPVAVSQHAYAEAFDAAAAAKQWEAWLADVFG